MNVQEERKNHQERNELSELFEELGVCFLCIAIKQLKLNIVETTLSIRTRCRCLKQKSICIEKNNKKWTYNSRTNAEQSYSLFMPYWTYFMPNAIYNLKVMKLHFFLKEEKEKLNPIRPGLLRYCNQMYLEKIKKLRIGWCIHHRMAANKAEGGGGLVPLPRCSRVKKREGKK